MIGFHCSHEQHSPSALLRYATLAAEAGFAHAMCSDHFAPWSERQGHSGYTWSWLGAALQATPMSFGTVCAPGQRYHPAIIAQAAGTLAEMYADRLWLAIGSGEAVNESIKGQPWPPKSARNTRLRESAEMMRALWAGQTVNMRGHVTARDARLWVRPSRPPLLLGAAISAQTARFVGEWADGLITINQPRAHLERMLAAFRENGGDGKPVAVQVHLSWAETEDEALRIAHDQWRTNIFPPPLPWDLATVEEFDIAGTHVRPEDMRGPVLVSADLAQHVGWIGELADVGFDAIYLHHVGKQQRPFVAAFGEHVLPAL
jgi:probable non-F420 flavinoid oxidoreductase